MRILQLDIGGQPIEFHPYVSVLRGMNDALRAQLVDAFVALTSGRPSTSGLVEAHGVVLDLSDETLDLLDLATLNGSLDVIVRPEQLPGAGAPDATRNRGQLERARSEAADRLARAEADADRARIALLASREVLEDHTSGEAAGSSLDSTRAELARLAARRAELESGAGLARAEHARAQDAQAVAEERVTQARSLRAEAARTCSVAAGALEAARAVRDPFAVSSLEAARERLGKLEAAGGIAVTVERDTSLPQFEDPAAEVERLKGRQVELEASLLALDTVDPYPVESALAQLQSTDDGGELVASDEAIRMADELARIDESVGTYMPADGGGSAITVARRRVETARTVLFEAERAVRLPEVDRDDVEALENAHEQVLLAQDRLDKRLAGGKAKQRLEEARVAEDEILGRLGFRTYTEFVMGTSIVNVDPERETDLEAAREELAAAEDALAQLEAGIDAELARAAMLARRRELVSAAVALLGRDPGDDIEWALRHHRVRVKDSTDRAGRLREALAQAGVMFGDDDPPASLLVDMATIWLDELAETASRRATLEHELQEVETQLALASEAARVQGERPSAEEAEEAAQERVARYEAQLEEARAAVRAAEQRLERQNQIEADIAQRKAELEAATQAEEAVAAALAEAEQEATAAAEAEHAAAGERARRDAELAATIDAERQATEALERLSNRLAQAATSDDATLEQAVVEAEEALERATTAVENARREVTRIEDELAGVGGEQAGSGDAGMGVSAAGTPSVEEIEWYLLSRVAAQRAVSYAGSVPLVLDDALGVLAGDELAHVLSRLERMSAAVQVVIISDDDDVSRWAESIGSDRAATLAPVPG